MTESAEDKRQDRRYLTDGRVTVCLLRVAGEPVADGTVTCSTGDISLRGVCLDLEFPLKTGDAVELHVQLASGGMAFPHIGRVAWCHTAATPGRYNAGIAFTTPAGPPMNEWRVALLALFE